AGRAPAALSCPPPGNAMLDDTLKTQLSAYLQRLTQPVEIVASLDARDVKETLRKLQAAQYVANNPGQVCPAKWQEGAKTLTPSLDLVGKI
ncbi:MAG: hypothetical protein ACM3O5_12845, partial [Betaproteobacteria bacterium]